MAQPPALPVLQPLGQVAAAAGQTRTGADVGGKEQPNVADAQPTIK